MKTNPNFAEIPSIFNIGKHRYIKNPKQARKHEKWCEKHNCPDCNDQVPYAYEVTQ